MKVNGHSQLRVFAFGVLFATLALAAAPYDFTGSWTGTAIARKTGATGTLTADFTPTAKPRKFTVSLTLAAAGQTFTCPYTAKYRKNLILHGHCGRASVITVHFDPAAQTLTGSFPVGHHHPVILSFTLARPA
jgi:hypothetical protein